MPKDKRNEGKKASRTQKQQMGAMPNAGNLYETGEELGRQQTVPKAARWPADAEPEKAEARKAKLT